MNHLFVCVSAICFSSKTTINSLLLLEFSKLPFSTLALMLQREKNREGVSQKAYDCEDRSSFSSLEQRVFMNDIFTLIHI